MTDTSNANDTGTIATNTYIYCGYCWGRYSDKAYRLRIPIRSHPAPNIALNLDLRTADSRSTGQTRPARILEI